MARTFVLITGAWHGGWAWRPVATRLRADGHAVHTPTLPGLADGDDPTAWHLSDVVDYVVDYVEQRDLRDVTLVAHSWGGYPAAGAAPRLVDRLEKLVFWSALVPAPGRAFVDEIPAESRAFFDGLAAESTDNTMLLPFEVFSEGLMGGQPEPVKHFLYDLLVPQPYQYFTETIEPVDLTSLGIPLAYVFSEDDVSMPPGEWGWVPRFPDRLGVDATLTPGGHESLFTHPAELARALLDA